MAKRRTPLSLFSMHKTPYGWPLRQLRIPQAHKTTRGAADVVVAAVDLGYRFHPDHEGHLWVNPKPTRDDVHGWDCFDGDASLEASGPKADTDYLKRHHAFVAGEVMACAPDCPVMIVRVGYGRKDSWWQGVDYAIQQGSKILVMPHGDLTEDEKDATALFYKGTDFCYPIDNPQLRRAFDDALDAGCLIVKGTADNRGRRVAILNGAHEAVLAVGSTNRQGGPADICCSADYVEVAAPGGQRSSKDERDHVWSTGGDADYVSCTGGCMASGFAGGVAALVWSQFPDLSVEQLRMVLRNTADSETWGPMLGWGVLNAARAVGLKREQLCQKLKVKRAACHLKHRHGKHVLEATVLNRGAFDVRRALVVAFNGNPLKPAVPKATEDRPTILVTRQIGHAIGPVRGLHSATFDIVLTEKPTARAWLQVCTLDHRGSDGVDTVGIRL